LDADAAGLVEVGASPASTRHRANWLLLVLYSAALRKTGRSLLVAFGVMVLTFSLLRLAPGDPAQGILGDTATPESIAEMRAKLGLTGSVLRQFKDYAVPLFHADLGKSIVTGQSVRGLIANALPVTLALIVLAMIFALGFSLLLAVPVARHRAGAAGLTFRVATSISLSIPVFFSGLILSLVFGLKFGLLPVGGYATAFPDNLRYLLLPAITACGPLVPILLRVLSSSVADTLDEAFVETAQVRGLRGYRLTWRYLIRPSLAPTIALSSYIIGSLFGAAIVLETVFNLPGIGSRLLTAVSARDYPVVQGVVLVLGILVVAINLAGDLLSGWLDPRARVTR
jgi:peptide/nickel transport system permease protein